MGIHDKPNLDKKYLDFLIQLNLYLNHFPKSEKFGLSQQIRNKAYDVYGFIVESQKRYHKKTSLNNLDISHEQLKMFIRLAFSLGYFSFKNGTYDDTEKEDQGRHRYFCLSKMLSEIGKMIGGWINSEKEKSLEEAKPK